jgi:GTP cyclohydrolase II
MTKSKHTHEVPSACRRFRCPRPQAAEEIGGGNSPTDLALNCPICNRAATVGACHTRFSVENRMHLICVPGTQFHTYDRLMGVISQNIAQNVQKRFINFYYTHEGRHEGLYTNNDNYEDATPRSR